MNASVRGGRASDQRAPVSHHRHTMDTGRQYAQDSLEAGVVGVLTFTIGCLWICQEGQDEMKK